MSSGGLRYADDDTVNILIVIAVYSCYTIITYNLFQLNILQYYIFFFNESVIYYLEINLFISTTTLL